VDLAELVRHTAEHFDALATERRVAYVVQTPDALGAQLDAEKVQRVLLNILSNAFKFTPAGGTIRVMLTEVAAATGEGITGMDRAVISVFDSGSGVPPDQREAIFERFQQGLAGTTRRFGGTGLGLAIAKDFVELHRGTISVGDAPGGGAGFIIQLPLVASRPASSRPSTPPEPGIAIDMARQLVDELRASPTVKPPQPVRSARVRGVPPGHVD
jgi:signal transduction histidine kinase